MSNCDWLTRITTNKAGAVALACRVLSAATILLPFGFVLAYPACSKDELKYVGDFPDLTKRQNTQIIDDGPVTVRYRHAPIVVVPAGSEVRPPLPEVQKQLPRVGKHYPTDTKSWKTETPTAVKVNKTGDFEPPTFNFPPDLLPGTTIRFQSEPTKTVPSGVKGKHRKAAPKHITVQDQSPIITSPVVLPGAPARLQVPEPQSRISRFGEQYDAAKEQSKKRGPALPPRGPIGDFPLPKPNFPREIGPAGKFAIPMTASPSMMHVPTKPMRAGGAAQKGDASRLIKPADRRASAVPIQTYSSGYVPGSALTDGKPNGCKLRAR